MENVSASWNVENEDINNTLAFFRLIPVFSSTLCKLRQISATFGYAAGYKLIKNRRKCCISNSFEHI